MSESRIRLIKNLSSSIFAPVSSFSEFSFKPSRKMTRNTSDSSFTHGGSRNSTPPSPYLKPLDHNTADFFGKSSSDFYRKDIKGTYSSQLIKPKKIIEFDKIANRSIENLSARQSKTPIKSLSALNSDNLTKNENREVLIECISVGGLKPDDTECTVKQLCSKVHIVKINVDVDNITGKCAGKATLQVRSYKDSAEVDSLKLRLMQKGYDVSAISAVKGRKNNYHGAKINFLDAQLQQEEKRLKPNSMSSKERKRAILATSDDLFGNSPGTGQTYSSYENEVDFKESRENQENMRKWKIVKSTPTKSPVRSLPSCASYSRATISSRNKNIIRG